jgi:glycosyltransferase involved in cell wall biosynthesis
LKSADQVLKVTFFNRSYWPDTGATGQLLTELAEDLVSHHGFTVTVVAGQPLTGTAAPGREMRNGVRIIRARGTRLAPTRFLARASNYVTYFASALLAASRLPRQDVVVALTDPPIIGLAALATRRGAPFVFFCQDIFPEVASLLDDFRSTTVNRALDRINRLLVARATRVIALGETMARRLVETKGADPARITVIHNWADTDAIAPADKANVFSVAHGLDTKFVVLHAGNIGMSQNLDVVLDAADRLRDRDRILFLFIGDGTRRQALEAIVRDRGLTNVRFLPFQPRDQLQWTYASADVCLVSLKPGLAGYIVPSKLYPILAAGRPFVAAVESDSEVAAIAERYGCGLLAIPGEADDLTRQIMRLADDEPMRMAMGQRARAAAAMFSRPRQRLAHAQLLEDACRAEAAHRPGPATAIL